MNELEPRYTEENRTSVSIKNKKTPGISKKLCDLFKSKERPCPLIVCRFGNKKKNVALHICILAIGIINRLALSRSFHLSIYHFVLYVFTFFLLSLLL